MLARGIDLSRRHKQLVGWAKSPGPLSMARRVGERSPVAAGDRFCPRGPPTWARRARFFMRGIFGGARLSPPYDLSQMTCFNRGSYCGSIPASWITLLHRAVSSAKYLAVSAREVAPGSSEIFCNIARTFFLL